MAFLEIQVCPQWAESVVRFASALARLIIAELSNWREHQLCMHYLGTASAGPQLIGY